ncbi:MAG: hypothetical protein WAS21_31170 [Geminicoccaceae bacterium]
MASHPVARTLGAGAFVIGAWSQMRRAADLLGIASLYPDAYGRIEALTDMISVPSLLGLAMLAGGILLVIYPQWVDIAKARVVNCFGLVKSRLNRKTRLYEEVLTILEQSATSSQRIAVGSSLQLLAEALPSNVQAAYMALNSELEKQLFYEKAVDRLNSIEQEYYKLRYAIHSVGLHELTLYSEMPASIREDELFDDGLRAAIALDYRCGHWRAVFLGAALELFAAEIRMPPADAEKS